MSNPFFSVVIPTYNCADFLRRALKSVEQQTFQDFEVIVVDNASTDHTDQVLQEYPSMQLKVMTIHNNGVIAASRNHGIRSSSGRWVAFLDSDDAWLPEKLASVKQAIEADSKVILVCHDERVVENGKPGRILHYGPATTQMYERLLFGGNALSTSAVTVCREVLERTGGFSEKEEFVTVEDYEYWLRLAKEGTFCFLTDVLGEYHLHGGNESTKIEKHVRALIAVVTHHLDAREGDLFDENRIRARQGTLWGTGARMLLKEGCFASARSYCRQSLAYDPFSLKALLVLLLAVLRIRM